VSSVGSQDDRPQCTALTAKGNRCLGWPVEGSEWCAPHLVRGRGRPTKLTPKLGDEIVTRVRLGAYVETVALAVGISKSTFYVWWARGGSGKPEDAGYADWRRRVEQAEAEAEVLMAGRVTRAANENWQAAQFWLERRKPDRWARMSQRASEDRPAVDVSEDDPFLEVDELAAARRRRRTG